MFNIDAPSLYRTVLEALACYAAIGVVGLLLGNPGFNGAVLHPYLVVVLFIAIRYSLQDGVAAALLGLACLWAGNVYLNRQAWFTSFNDRDTAFLLICASVSAGLLTDATRKKLQGLRRVVAEQGEQILHLTEKAQVLGVANEELRKRIVGEEATLSTFQHVAHRLAMVKLDDLYLAILDLVVEYLGAESCSRYLLENNLLREHRGPGSVPDDERVLTLGFDLVSRAATEKRLVSFKDLRAPQAGTPHLLAVPLQADSEVLGVIVIDKLPFVKFTGTNTRLLTVIANWGAEAIQSARHGARFRAVDEQLASALTPQFFRRRVKEEILRSRRSKQTNWGISAVVIDLPTDKPMRERTERAISLILTLGLQETDVVGHTREGAFGALLINLKEGSVSAIHQRLSSQIADCLPRWLPGCQLQIRIGHCAYGVIDDIDSFIRNAELLARPVQLPVDISQLTTRTDFSIDVQVANLMGKQQLQAAIDLLLEAVEQHPLEMAYRHQLIRVYLAMGDDAAFGAAVREYAIVRNRQGATLVQDQPE